VYNVARGSPRSLLDLLELLGRILAVDPRWVHTAPRPGDVRDSCADAAAAVRDLGFACEVDLEEGLRQTVDWFVRA
jgi:UDP-N-acetylglucosamine/UDP-N-acetyl-alpha-D-glucosaminouronate 4-epimerase